MHGFYRVIIIAVVLSTMLLLALPQSAQNETDAEQHLALVLQFLDDINDKKFDNLGQMFASRVISHAPDHQRIGEFTPVRVQNSFRGLEAAFPDFIFTVENIATGMMWSLFIFPFAEPSREATISDFAVGPVDPHMKR